MSLEANTSNSIPVDIVKGPEAIQYTSFTSHSVPICLARLMVEVNRLRVYVCTCVRVYVCTCVRVYVCAHVCAFALHCVVWKEHVDMQIY